MSKLGAGGLLGASAEQNIQRARDEALPGESPAEIIAQPVSRSALGSGAQAVGSATTGASSTKQTPGGRPGPRAPRSLE